MNKKGNALSIIVWTSSVVIIIFFLAGWMYFHHQMTLALLNAGSSMNTDLFNLTQITEQVVVPLDNALNSLTWISFVMIVCLALSILIENFYIREHPVLFFVHVLIVILGIIGAIYISNAYQDLVNTPPLNSILSSFTMSNLVVLYLPLWVAVIGIFGLILLVINANRDPEMKVRGGI